MLTGCVDDLRVALRSLRRRPAFAFTAITALAIGAGPTTAVYSVLDGVVLSPLPYPKPERLVAVWSTPADAPGHREGPSPLDLVDWRREVASIEHWGASYMRTATVRGEGAPESIRVAGVTPGFFPALGVPPALGRVFDAASTRGAVLDGAGRAVRGDRLAVISHGLWQRRYGGDPGIAGRDIEIDRVGWRIVGVMPGSFLHPDPSVDAWLAWDAGADDPPRLRNARFLDVVARLAPGASPERAQDELDRIADALERAHPLTNDGWGVRLEPLSEHLTRDVRAALWLVFGAAALVLVVAVANAAGLFAVRAHERRREVALRRALGVSRARLARLWLAESLWIVLAGACGAAALAHATLSILVALRPAGLPRIDEVGLDARSVAFLAVVGGVAAVVFGLVPAVAALRRPAAEVLQATSARSGGTGQRLRRSLVVAQVAATLVLVVGAGLFARSLGSLLGVAPGFATERLLVTRLAVEEDAGPFYRELTGRLGSLPGVTAAGAGTSLPLSDVVIDFDRPYWRDGEPRDATSPRQGYVIMATPGYFETLEIPIVRGRAFDAGDRQDGRRVTIVSTTLARREWADADPVGQRLVIDYLGGQYPYEVVGVAGDTRFWGARSEPRAEIFLPHAQVPYLALNVAVRTAGDSRTLAPEVRRVIQELDPQQAVQSMVTIEELVARSTAQDRYRSLILGAFALVALFVAATGLYGLLAYLVSRRTREIGIRMALGAEPRRIAGAVVGESLVLVGAGLALGGLAAVVAAQWVRGQLYGVTPLDPVALAGSLCLIGLVGLAASVAPALRALRTEPVTALREE